MENEEKKELIEAAKGLPPSGEIFSLRPRTFEEAYRFANLMASSDLVPKEFRNNPANVLLAVQLGHEVGLNPMQAIQSIAVINGRPCMWGDAVLGIVQASGLLEVINESVENDTGICTVKRKGNEPLTRSFSMEEAKKAGLIERGAVWKTYPKRMLQMRARSFALRDGFADVLKGLHVREEVEDFDPGEAVEVGRESLAPPTRLSERPAEEATDVKDPQSADNAPELKFDANA